LTNEIEYYMQQWSYIKIRQAKKKNLKIKRWFISCFVTNSHRLSWTAKK
jgi:hypothetical protein